MGRVLESASRAACSQVRDRCEEGGREGEILTCTLSQSAWHEVFLTQQSDTKGLLKSRQLLKAQWGCVWWEPHPHAPSLSWGCGSLSLATAGPICSFSTCSSVRLCLCCKLIETRSVLHGMLLPLNRVLLILPVVSTTVWRFLIFQNIPVHNAITTSGLVCVGETRPDLAAEHFDARLQLGKKVHLCVSALHRDMGMGSMRNPDKWLRCSGLNHYCSPRKLGWLHIPF